MKEMDRETINSGFPALLLMDTAGRGVANVAREYLDTGDSVVVFCGKGNNGGDGFVAARFLDIWGYNVDIILVGKKNELSGNPQKNYHICNLRDINVREYENLNKEETKEYIKKSSLVIDALLGTGLKGNVRGDYVDIIELINSYSQQVLAVDIPSGLDGEKGKVLGTAVKANTTVTMAFSKVGLCIYPGINYTGKVEIVNLGMPDCCINKVNYNHYMLTDKEAGELLPKRPANGHKGNFGKIGVIGGSPGMAGAPVLTGISALRVGCGLVKLAVPEEIQQIAHAHYPELLTTKFTDNSEFDLDEINGLINFSDVLAVGPGLGSSDNVRMLIKELLSSFKLPVVLDADGLNAINNLQLLSKYKGDLILTPHPGEMARLVGKSIEEVNTNRIDIARNFACEYQVYLILKGAATVIALPDGDIYINPTGNEGMATAGSGDVLTGILAGLLGQGLNAKNASILAPYLHGLTADFIDQDKSTGSLVASDLVNNISWSVKYLKRDT